MNSSGTFVLCDTNFGRQVEDCFKYILLHKYVVVTLSDMSCLETPPSAPD